MNDRDAAQLNYLTLLGRLDVEPDPVRRAWLELACWQAHEYLTYYERG